MIDYDKLENIPSKLLDMIKQLDKICTRMRVNINVIIKNDVLEFKFYDCEHFFNYYISLYELDMCNCNDFAIEKYKERMIQMIIELISY